MEEPKIIKETFKFYTRLSISELTNLRAKSLGELLECIKKAPDSSMYHHTHRFLQQHQFLSPEPPNDFAYWVSNVLGEKRLGEELASIDTVQFGSISDLRKDIISTIEQFLNDRKSDELRVVGKDEAFYFIKSISFILPTKHTANDLKEFVDALEKVTIDSIYFHIFEARLRLGKGDNDFSRWIKDFAGNKKIADEISKLDPYTYTLEELREMIVKIIKRRINE